MGMAGQEDIEASLSSSKEGPVLTMINKRLRALRKKNNKILQIEESKAQGKQINKEQEEVLKGKLVVGVLIEEYEKLRPLLKEEIDKELMEFRLKMEEESIAGDEEHANPPLEEKEIMDTTLEKVDTNVDVEEENAGTERVIEGDAVCDEGLRVEKSSDISENDGSQRRESLESGVGPFELEVNDLLHLLYFAQLFDVALADASPSLMWTKIHERSSCVSYDCVTEEDSSSPLEESDLNNLSLLGSLITSRPPNATLSHRDALQQCARHALLWLGNSDAPIKEGLRVTYSHLRERLSRILSSEYYTMIPELQTFGQHTVAAATAGSAGQYPPQLLIQAALTAAGPPLYYASQDTASEPHLLGGDHYPAPLPMRNFVSELPESYFGMSATTAYIPESNVSAKVDVEATTGVSMSKEEQPQDLQSASAEPPQTALGEETQDQQQEGEAATLTSDTRAYQGPNGGVVPGTNHVKARSTPNSRGYGMIRGGQGNGRGSHAYDQKGYYQRNQNGRGSGRGMRAGGSSTFNGYANGQANNRTSGAPPM